jgi:5'(3')-deoxyribonucleotidase
MIDRIYIDMDGVLVDWMSQVLEEIGRPGKLIQHWDMREVGGWDHVKSSFTPTVAWWENLPKYEWAEDLVAACERRAKVYILSSCRWHPSAYEGKTLWIRKHFPHLEKTFVAAHSKDACASEYTLLIDDYDENIDAFEEYSGYTILFPRTWNTARGDAHDPLTYVKERLKCLR